MKLKQNEWSLQLFVIWFIQQQMQQFSLIMPTILFHPDRTWFKWSTKLQLKPAQSLTVTLEWLEARKIPSLDSQIRPPIGKFKKRSSNIIQSRYKRTFFSAKIKKPCSIQETVYTPQWANRRIPQVDGPEATGRRSSVRRKCTDPLVDGLKWILNETRIDF